MRTLLIALPILLFAHFSAAERALRAEETSWPHLRGPNYNAHSPESGLAENWPADGPPRLWTCELGEGYSGIVAVGNRVFTQFQTRGGQFVVCFDSETGNELWRERVDWPWQLAGAYPGPYATPTYANERVYYTTPSGLAGCLDAATGRSRWSLNLEKFHGEGTQFGYAATPLVEDGRVILPVGGKGASMVALNADDGATLWTTGNDAASYTPAFPLDFQGRRLVIGYLRNAIVAVEAASGKLVWRNALSAGYDEHSAWPLWQEPNLWISAPFRSGSKLLEFGANETDLAARTVWSNKHMSNDVCSSVLIGGHVYGFDLHQQQSSAHRPSRGRFKCIDFATGTQNWETDKVGQATALVAAGKLFLLSETGALILARANSEAYTELARTQVFDDGLCWSPPALLNGKLFVRSPACLTCLFVGEPEQLKRDVRPTVASVSTPRFTAAWILTREPKFPYDPPTSHDLQMWFLWGLFSVFGPAALLALIAWTFARACGFASRQRWAFFTFVAASFLLSAIGTTIFSLWADTLVLTWPAGLYLAFRLTVGSACSTTSAKPSSNWKPRFAILLFAAICFAYYRLCLTVGYVMAWTFLIGFLPAAPAAIIAARSRNLWIRVPAEIAAFVIYFWASGRLPAWKATA